MLQNYYGQFLDDKLIEEYFDSGYIGGCIDVGATNGVDINNTKHFEENGWYCLCVEPNPNSFEKLKINRKNSVNFAISDFNKDLVDFTIVNLNNNSVESEGAISSLNIDKRLYQEHLNMGFNLTVKNIKVSARTLDYCIENYYKYDKIDFLDIDTEGTELDVLKGFDINRWQPKLIVVENNYNIISEVENYLKQFDYIKDKRVGVNEYYIKNKKKNFLIGGKLGDFLHSLYAVKCLSDGFKSDVYITEAKGAFTNGIENTYNDIYDVVKQQSYIDNFLIYDNKINDYVNIGYSNMDYLFKTSWYEIYQKNNNITNKFEDIPWLTRLKNPDYEYYRDKIVVHFSTIRYDESYDILIENILQNNKCIFISTNIEEYDKFKFKSFLEFKHCENFLELYSIIENCKFFIGNQSMHLAIAHGLFKSHLGFLFSIDSVHYKDIFNKNYFWFDDQKNISDNFNEIKTYLKIKNIEIQPNKINLDDVKFNIECKKNINQVLIYCNFIISVYIIIYEYDIITGEKNLLFSTLTNFDNCVYWYSPEREIINFEHIKVEILFDGKILTEKIF
jgi:FkbM family methyltransferase